MYVSWVLQSLFVSSEFLGLFWKAVNVVHVCFLGPGSSVSLSALISWFLALGRDFLVGVTVVEGLGEREFFVEYGNLNDGIPERRVKSAALATRPTTVFTYHSICPFGLRMSSDSL